MRKGVFFLSIFLVCVLFAVKVEAQIQDNDFILKISPEYPRANEQVFASVSTYATNLDNTNITWILNGETKLSGIGKKTFSFHAGANDSQTVLEAIIQTINGSTVNRRIVISPKDVDILWEAYNTYAPPFYKGKILMPAEGMAKVVAIPNPPSKSGYNYNWKLDGKSKQSSSGFEKNYLIYKNAYLDNENSIDVYLSDIFGNGAGRGSVTITPGSPKILFYKKDLSIGTRWESSLESIFGVSENGETLVAEPYFFFPKNLNSNVVSFNWYINGEKTKKGNPINELSLKKVSESSGQAVIKTIINNTATLFESVEKSFNVGF